MKNLPRIVPSRAKRGGAKQVVTRLFEDQLSFFQEIGAPYGEGDFSRELRQIVYLGMGVYRNQSATNQQSAKNA